MNKVGIAFIAAMLAFIGLVAWLHYQQRKYGVDHVARPYVQFGENEVVALWRRTSPKSERSAADITVETFEKYPTLTNKFPVAAEQYQSFQRWFRETNAPWWVKQSPPGLALAGSGIVFLGTLSMLFTLAWVTRVRERLFEVVFSIVRFVLYAFLAIACAVWIVRQFTAPPAEDYEPMRGMGR